MNVLNKDLVNNIFMRWNLEEIHIYQLLLSCIEKCENDSEDNNKWSHAFSQYRNSAQRKLDLQVFQ